jgi:hypothetical protein
MSPIIHHQMLEEMLKVTINYKFKHKFNFIDILVGTPEWKTTTGTYKNIKTIFNFLTLKYVDYHEFIIDL